MAADQELIDNDGVSCVAAATCDACGSDGAVLYTGLRDRLFGAPGVWSVRRCAKPACGLGWLDPRPRSDEIGKLYASYYTHEAAGDENAASLSDAGTSGKARAKRLLARLLPWRRHQFRSGLCHLEDMVPGSLLEVGCGSGTFLRDAAAAGWTAHGIDFDEKAVAAANAIPGVTARVDDLLGAGFEDERFDALVMNNVIEHLPDPAAVFAECRRVLRPGGRAVMVTPNLDALGHRVFGPDWRGLEVPRHLYLYTDRTLAGFARRAGFRAVSAFSPIGGGGAEFMVDASKEIARRSQRVPPVVDPAALRRRARMLAAAGVNRGEWVVLVAER